MTDAAVAPLERARKLAERAAIVAVVAATLIAVGAVAEVAAPAVRAFRTGDVTLDWRGALTLFRTVGAFLVLALPGFLLAGALFELSKVLDEYGKGLFFTLRASAGVRKAAELALWALAAKILISPTVFSWITQEGRGFIWNFEQFDLGLIAFAAFVAVLGRLLEAASEIKAENEQIV